MPDWLSTERRAINESLAADLIPGSKSEGGFLGSISRAEAMADRDPDLFLPRQFANQANAEALQKTTGPECWQQLRSIGQTPDAFVAGLGTGGTVMGMRAYLVAKNPNCQVHPLEPAESPTLSTGHQVGSHRIQGVSDEFIPAIVDLSLLAPVLQVPDGDAILMAQQLARQLGLDFPCPDGQLVLGILE